MPSSNRGGRNNSNSYYNEQQQQQQQYHSSYGGQQQQQPRQRPRQRQQSPQEQRHYNDDPQHQQRRGGGGGGRYPENDYHNTNEYYHDSNYYNQQQQQQPQYRQQQVVAGGSGGGQRRRQPQQDYVQQNDDYQYYNQQPEQQYHPQEMGQQQQQQSQPQQDFNFVADFTRWELENSTVETETTITTKDPNNPSTASYSKESYSKGSYYSKDGEMGGSGADSGGLDTISDHDDDEVMDDRQRQQQQYYHDDGNGDDNDEPYVRKPRPAVQPQPPPGGVLAPFEQPQRQHQHQQYEDYHHYREQQEGADPGIEVDIDEYYYRDVQLRLGSSGGPGAAAAAAAAQPAATATGSLSAAAAAAAASAAVVVSNRVGTSSDSGNNVARKPSSPAPSYEDTEETSNSRRRNRRRVKKQKQQEQQHERMMRETFASTSDGSLGYYNTGSGGGSGGGGGGVNHPSFGSSTYDSSNNSGGGAAAGVNKQDYDNDHDDPDGDRKMPAKPSAPSTTMTAHARRSSDNNNNTNASKSSGGGGGQPINQPTSAGNNNNNIGSRSEQQQDRGEEYDEEQKYRRRPRQQDEPSLPSRSSSSDAARRDDGNYNKIINNNNDVGNVDLDVRGGGGGNNNNNDENNDVTATSARSDRRQQQHSRSHRPPPAQLPTSSMNHSGSTSTKPTTTTTTSSSGDSFQNSNTNNNSNASSSGGNDNRIAVVGSPRPSQQGSRSVTKMPTISSLQSGGGGGNSGGGGGTAHSSEQSRPSVADSSVADSSAGPSVPQRGQQSSSSPQNQRQPQHYPSSSHRGGGGASSQSRTTTSNTGPTAENTRTADNITAAMRAASAMQQLQQQQGGGGLGGGPGGGPGGIQREQSSIEVMIRKVAVCWIETIPQSVEHLVVTMLQQLATTAARNPIRFYTYIMSFSICLFVIGLFTNYSIEIDEVELWSPKDGIPENEKEWIDKQSNFPVPSTRPVFLIFYDEPSSLSSSSSTSSSSSDAASAVAVESTVVGQEPVKRIFDTLEKIRSLDRYETICANFYVGIEDNEYDEGTDAGTTTQSQISTQQQETVNVNGGVDPPPPPRKYYDCPITSVTGFWNHDKEIFERDVNNVDDAIRIMSGDIYPNGIRVIEDEIFGMPVRDNVTNVLTDVSSYLLRIDLPDTDSARSFELDIIDVVLYDLQFAMKVDISTKRSYMDEYNYAIRQNLMPLVIIMFVTTCITTAIIYFKPTKKIDSHILLGLSSLMSIIMSLLTSFGILFLYAIEFTYMTQIVCFIMVPIGIIDTHLLYLSYCRTQRNEEIIKRIQDSIIEVGYTITMSNMTIIGTFSCCLATRVPTAYWICLYAIPSVFICYLYTFTFFVACIVLDEKRMQELRRDCCSWLSVSDAEGEMDEYYDEDDDEDDDDEIDNMDNHHHHHRGGGTSGGVGVGGGGVAGAGRRKKTLSDRIMEWYGNKILHNYGKIIVLLIWIGIMVGSSISVSRLRHGLILDDTLPPNSYYKQYLESHELFISSRTNSNIEPMIYFRDVDHSNPQVRYDMISYIKNLVEIDAIQDMPNFCWIIDFEHFLNTTTTTTTNNNETTGILTANFNDQLNEFLSHPVYGTLYKDHIARSNTNDENENTDDGYVTASRCAVRMDNVDINNIEEQINALQDQRNVTVSQPINRNRFDYMDDYEDNNNNNIYYGNNTANMDYHYFFTYDDTYSIWEFYEILRNELVRTCYYGITAIITTYIIMAPDCFVLIYAIPIIISMYIELLGILQLSNVQLNYITYVIIFVTVSMFICYINHILVRYFQSNAMNKHDKVMDLLRTIGPSLLHGSAIMVMGGIIPLTLTRSKCLYYRTLTITIVGWISVGLFNGLAVLPVILSIIGPEQQQHHHLAAAAQSSMMMVPPQLGVVGGVLPPPSHHHHHRKPNP